MQESMESLYKAEKNYSIEKLAMQFSVNNPRVTTTLFSTAQSRKRKKNVA
jgi:hypothetical protein